MATYTPKRKTLTGTESVQFPISAVNGLADMLDGKVSMITVPTEASTTVINMINMVRSAGADISDWNIIKLRGYITDTYGLQISHYGGAVYHIQGVDLTDMSVISNTTDWTGMTLGAFQTMFYTFQKSTDYGLQTTDQTIVGAINELADTRLDKNNTGVQSIAGGLVVGGTSATATGKGRIMLTGVGNPLVGLQAVDSSGNQLTPYYFQVANDIMYVGPTSAKALAFDSSGNVTTPGALTVKGSITEGGTALSAKYASKSVATSSTAGLMSPTDKAKLDSLNASGGSSTGMPQIRFAGLSGYGIVHSTGESFTINGTQYKGNKLGLHFTVEIVGGGPLKVGDAIQMCSKKTYPGCRGNEYRRRQKLRRFKEYVITENDLDKRFITIHIENDDDIGLRDLFHNGRTDTNKYSPVYFRIRRPKGRLQDNDSGMTVDAEFSNVVTVWKSYGFDFEDDDGQTYDKFSIL